MTTIAPPQRLTDRKRCAIVDAAISAFRALGFEATSMDRIAADAGVSKRTVYNHFPSKDELFAEILARLWASTAEAETLGYDAAQPLRPQLEALLMQKMRLLDDPNFLDLARVAIGEAIHAPERALAMVARMGSKEAGVTAWVRAAHADGKLKLDDPVFAANMLQGQLKAMAFWPQVGMGAARLSDAEQRKVVAATAAMFLATYA